ncbi:MAG: TIGR01906 family membrane protein [bacterium]|nr:TIGR01906 family membrane protein [bacterium]
MAEASLSPVSVEIKPVNRGLRWTARLFLTLAVPVLLVLFSVRLVMTPLFLQLEYNRPGFPEDDYGFTREDRLRLAPYAVNYLLNDADIGYLGDLTFPDGSPLYNERELRHMEDVKVVTRAAFTFLIILSLGAAVVTAVLAYRAETRRDLRTGLMQGSILTLSIIGTIIVVAIAAWDFFFTAFHEVFFESGTWRFLYSDTLIRLFPEQFWFDAALTIGGLTTLGAVVIFVSMWRWGKSAP